MKTDSESLPVTAAGSEFQTDGTAHREVSASEWLDVQWCSRQAYCPCIDAAVDVLAFIVAENIFAVFLQ